MARFAVGLSLFCMLLVSDPAINSAFAQTTTGLPPFATINSGLYDAVKINDGAILLTLPVRSKAGLIPFDYSLTLNSTVGISDGYVLINTLQWSPRTSVGFSPAVTGGSKRIHYSNVPKEKHTNTRTMRSSMPLALCIRCPTCSGTRWTVSHRTSRVAPTTGPATLWSSTPAAKIL